MLFFFNDTATTEIYTTNAAGSLDSVIFEAIKRRKVFPSYESAKKVVYPAIEQAFTLNCLLALWHTLSTLITANAMSQNLVPFFALQAVALAILCIALWLCSKSAQRIAPFYLFFLSLSSEFVGTMLRLMSFFCGTQVLLIGAGRQYDDFWTRVDTSGVLLFAFGLFLKPLFFLSIVETITFKRYLYVSFVFVLFAVLPAIGFRHYGYSTTRDRKSVV